MTKKEKEIINTTKEFSETNNIHYDELTESMILNAMREVSMENQIVKLSDLKPASFDDRNLVRVTDGQNALIAFIKDKAEKGEIITRDNLLDFYIEKVKGSEYYKVYGKKSHPDPNYTHMIPDFDNYRLAKWREVSDIKSQAIQWFKNNLGACILKGKLLAIPIIEV